MNCMVPLHCAQYEKSEPLPMSSQKVLSLSKVLRLRVQSRLSMSTMLPGMAGRTLAWILAGRRAMGRLVTDQTMGAKRTIHVNPHIGRVT
jgi:hypothetical protein